ncbi:NADP-dependent 3-hydroxy acid dehydrogenase YdfG [Peribacillus deserti]|uniref:NADP-dependent 3-hydroxy acid dehydrogenase YdfG n=1 Tax=Peribacillus deserti TaxID=673318 RepID=A0ABS2QNE2_9BACI|nr:NADP-dependent 3-hydroxy acid dehydrogenase YdfG [Peribacillus deserti]
MAQDLSNVRVTIVSPGAINTELLESVTDNDFKNNFEDFYENFGIPAERVALTIKQAIDLPDDAAWNEVIIRPTKQVM